jgi:hypothetical protein
MSASGHKRRFCHVCSISAYPPIADMTAPVLAPNYPAFVKARPKTAVVAFYLSLRLISSPHGVRGATLVTANYWFRMSLTRE